MQHIGSHIKPGSNSAKSRATERGELMRYFMHKLNMTRSRDVLPPLTMGRMGRVLVAIPTKDLYFLKSVCDDASKRGDISSFSKKFWWEINPKNHTEEAKKKQEKEFSNRKKEITQGKIPKSSVPASPKMQNKLQERAPGR